MKLLEQAGRGELNGVKALIQQGFDVNTTNHCNESALYFACKSGCTEVARYLLDNGADVELGSKPLIAAVRGSRYGSHFDCVRLLLEHHADVNCTVNQESPMSVAVQGCDCSAVLLLLKYNAVPTASLNNIASTLLASAKPEDLQEVQKLVDSNFISLTSNVFGAMLDYSFKSGSLAFATRMLSSDSYAKIDHISSTAVYHCAKNNWPALLSQLFEKKVDVNVQVGGETPLYAACKGGHENVVALLLDNGADPNTPCSSYVYYRLNDWTVPLQVAVRQRNVVICNMLLQKSAKLDTPGQPLLHIACGDVDKQMSDEEHAESTLLIIRLLLLHEGVNVNALYNRATALYCACRTRQQLEVVQVLLEAGADVNLKSGGCYPLIAACSSGNIRLINLLIKAGADVKCRNYNEETCLHSILKAYSSISNSQKPTDIVSRLDILNTIKSLLDAGVDVDACTTVCSREETALYQASKAGHEDVVRLLLESGAAVNETRRIWRTPLCAACENGHEKIVAFLLAYGADPNIPDMKHLSYCQLSLPLELAVERRNSVICNMLLEKGANLCYGEDPWLHIACSAVDNKWKSTDDVVEPSRVQRASSVIRLLLQRGVNVNDLSDRGDTALYRACAGQQPIEVVQLLLDAGADVNLTSRGCYPLMAACESGNIQLADLLIKEGADVKCRSFSSETCLHAIIGAYSSDSQQSTYNACKFISNIERDHFMMNETSCSDDEINNVADCAVQRFGERANLTEYNRLITLLLQRGVPVNVCCSKWRSALYVACMKGLSGAVKQLLDHGADVDLTKDNYTTYPLWITCKYRFRDIAVMLLERGANTNVMSRQTTPLILASTSGDDFLVKRLLASGADVNQAQGCRYTALHAAALRRKCLDNKVFVSVVAMLLKCGADPNALSYEDETPLFLACASNDGEDIDVNLRVVQLLLEYGADPNICPAAFHRFSLENSRRRTFSPLSAAALYGKSELAALLIEYGAKPDHSNDLDSTALHLSVDDDIPPTALKSRTSAAEILLSAGADANAMDKSGSSPLYLACKSGYIEFVELFLSFGANPNIGTMDKYPLHGACEGRRCDVVKLLLNYNADVDVCGENGVTALHHTLLYRSDHSFDCDKSTVPNLVQLLLDRGADPNVTALNGETPFCVACSRGLLSVVVKMLEFGAKVDGNGSKKKLSTNGANPNISDIGDHYGCSLPLHSAAAGEKSSELVEMLLEHGANVNATDASGNTALHSVYSCEETMSEEVEATSRTKSVVDILLENGADINAVNSSGETPLCRAVSIRDEELVEMLLQRGADPNLSSSSCGPESKCRLPLFVAMEKRGRHHDDIIALLVKAGADVNVQNHKGKNALFVAIEVFEHVLSKRHFGDDDQQHALLTISLLLDHGANLNTFMPDGRRSFDFVTTSIAELPRHKHKRKQLILLLQMMVKHGAILLRSSGHLGVDEHPQSPRDGTLKALATFYDKDEFVLDLFRAGAGFQLLRFFCDDPEEDFEYVSSVRLCQAVIMAGYSPGADELRSLALRDEEDDVRSVSEDSEKTVEGDGLREQLVNWINEDRQRVPSLLRQCRVLIRQRLSEAVNYRSILPSIDKLPLPNDMKLYLQFEGVMTEIDLGVHQETTENSSDDYSSEGSDDDLYDSDGDRRDFFCGELFYFYNV